MIQAKFKARNRNKKGKGSSQEKTKRAKETLKYSEIGNKIKHIFKRHVINQLLNAITVMEVKIRKQG